MRKVQLSKVINIVLLSLILMAGFWSVCVKVQAAEQEKVSNILLIGVDRRDDSWNGNSDTMILVSINDEKKQVSMISLMRDTGVDVPGCGTHKLNYAHAYGGPDLLMETIEHNYDVEVESYISVDFEGMIEIVDAVGGVELTLSDAEASCANNYVNSMCSAQGLSPDSYLFPSGGTYVCNGMRAVSYARVRYVGNADYERTERQRTVVMKIIEKLKAMNASELLSFAMTAMSLTDFNIPVPELIELVGKAPELSGYEIVLDRIPYDGLYYSQNEMLMPDWGETIEKLKETIY